MITYLQRHPASQEEVAGGPGYPAGPKHKDGFPAIVDHEEIIFSDPMPDGKKILEKAGKLPVTCYSLYMKLADCDFEKVSLEQVVDLRNPGIEHFVTKDPEVYPYTINEDPELTEEKLLTPFQILKNAGLDPENVYLIQKEEGGQEIVYAFKPDEPIRMHCRGLTFITGEWLDCIDIEQYGKTCRCVTPARHYIIKIDKQTFTVDSPFIKAENLIKLVVKDNPANYNLIKFISNSPKPVPVPFTSVVDLAEACLVRFVVQPKTQSDGERRNFSLPENDAVFLTEMGFHWEALSENRYQWLLIHDYPLPEGYHAKTSTVALMVPPAYPASEIDMAYFYPPLVKVSGKVINATSSQVIEQRVFQRWSRHRKPGDWKPGIDNIATHLTLVNNWLENDISR